MTGKSVHLKKGEGRILRANGFWVYDNEIASLDENIKDGDLVDIYSNTGFFMGTGFYNSKSKIRIRLMTRNKDAVIDRAFLKKRVADAWNYRKAVMGEEDSIGKRDASGKIIEHASCRVVFGEADFLPGITIDKYSDVLVVESLALGIDLMKEDIVDCLKEVLAEDGINIKGVYERSDAKVREKEGLPRVKDFIGDEFDTNVNIVENGVKYCVDVAEGQKTGFFLDQKYNRLAVRKVCRNASVLDCCTHTGAFALNAVAGGASQVTALDASEDGIAMAKKNAELNGFIDRMDFLTGDMFELLPELYEKGKRYDVVILDPPAFTKSRASIKKAVTGYKEVNMRGMHLVKPGGFLVTCSCSHFMDPELFADTIGKAAHDAKVVLRQVEFKTQSPDHPIVWADSDSYYLKFYLFQVLPAFED